MSTDSVRKAENPLRTERDTATYLHFGDAQHLPMQTRSFTGTDAQLLAVNEQAVAEKWPLRVQLGTAPRAQALASVLVPEMQGEPFRFRQGERDLEAPHGLGSFYWHRRDTSTWCWIVYVTPQGEACTLTRSSPRGGNAFQVPPGFCGDLWVPADRLPALPQAVGDQRRTGERCLACGQPCWVELSGFSTGYCTYCYRTG